MHAGPPGETHSDEIFDKLIDADEQQVALPLRCLDQLGAEARLREENDRQVLGKAHLGLLQRRDLVRLELIEGVVAELLALPLALAEDDHG